jgi:hypothetical protein
MINLIQSRELLETRYLELSKFLEHLAELDIARMGSGHQDLVLPSSEVTAVMKATVLIMNYSAVEATIVEIIDEVFSFVKNSGVKFRGISQGVRKQLLSYKLRHIRSAGDSTIESFVDDTLRWALEDVDFWLPDKGTIRDSFLGNLDAKKIRSVMDQMGIAILASRRTRNGSDLKEVKDSRNYLAHGYKSFVDLGQLKTVSELHSQTKRIAEYLLAIIRAFERELKAGRVCAIMPSVSDDEIISP